MKQNHPTKDKIFTEVSGLLGLTQNLLKKKIVFTNGCFDILHVGHIDYLEKAANKGDFMIVGLNSDDSVNRLKGNSRPINSWEDRATMLAALAFVDAVILFEADTPLQLIETIKPQVLIKGSDYDIENIVGAKSVLESGGSVETIDFVHQISTSAILEKIIAL